MEACLGLRKLRMLRFFTWTSGWPQPTSEAVNPEVFSAVAMLPELSTFKVNRSVFRVLGWDLEDFVEDIRAQVNVDRHDKGWPPLKLVVDDHSQSKCMIRS